MGCFPGVVDCIRRWGLPEPGYTHARADGNTVPYIGAYTHTDSYSYLDADAYTSTDGDAHCNPNGHADSDPDADSDSDCYTDADSHSDCYTDADSHSCSDTVTVANVDTLSDTDSLARGNGGLHPRR